MYITSIKDLDDVYTTLRLAYPTRQIQVDYDYTTKRYTVTVTNEKYTHDPRVATDFSIRVIYGDTDSIFVLFKYAYKNQEQNRIDTFKLATLLGNIITQKVIARHPVELEFEKVFTPFVLITKKRYIAKAYTDLKDPFKCKGIDSKGTALVRRDFSPFVKKCYKQVVQEIFEGNQDGINQAIKVYKRYIDKLDEYDVPLQDLVLSSTLAKEYKTRPVHVILAEKLRARGVEVQLGDRIPYVYIEGTGKKSELGENPDYVELHDLKINRACYLESLARTLLGFFKVALNNDPSTLEHLVDYTNERLASYSHSKLRVSDFVVED